MWPTVIFVGALESFSYEKVYYTDKAPGDLGFDPLRFGQNPASRAHYAVCSHSFSCSPVNFGVRVSRVVILSQLTERE